ncbi:RNA polymerase sigma factor [Solirubrobacter soli]|uniref:RNA polymerase sigma factor n=1 Tax=Solirubrobacter soli TaxID=363832 RepID=UPI00041B1486|nr:sigma-70 family RNA polymerase sigma factor [Solirubrobacter soli]
MTETQLVRAAAARDPQAVATLYRTHFGTLQRRALAITGCPEDAADAAQDALLATFARLPQLDPDTVCFGAYATTVARHEALKRRRVIATPAERVLVDDPHTHLERAELRQRVRTAIKRLPERQRTVIFRNDFEQADRKDIAAELGLTENATGQLLFRARRNLQSSLAAS